MSKQARKLRVSDHALLRFAERVNGFDVEAARAAIVKAVGTAQAVIGEGKFPVCPGFVAVVQRNTVVTVVPKD